MAESEEKAFKEERSKVTSILRIYDPTLLGGSVLAPKARVAAEQAVRMLTTNELSFLTTIRDSRGTFRDYAVMAEVFDIQPILAWQRERNLNAKLIGEFEKEMNKKGRLAEIR